MVLFECEERCENCRKVLPTKPKVFDMEEIGIARALLYGFKFKNFCSDKCSKKYHKGKETITAEQFATADLKNL